MPFGTFPAKKTAEPVKTGIPAEKIETKDNRCYDVSLPTTIEDTKKALDDARKLQDAATPNSNAFWKAKDYVVILKDQLWEMRQAKRDVEFETRFNAQAEQTNLLINCLKATIDMQTRLITTDNEVIQRLEQLCIRCKALEETINPLQKYVDPQENPQMSLEL